MMARDTTTFAIGSGKNFADLGNAVSDAIYAALNRGMEVDEAVCCVVKVAADYAAGAYGAAYLNQLASVITGAKLGEQQ